MAADSNHFTQQAHAYFTCFNHWDVAGLRELFAPEVTLTDWNGHWEGIESVLTTNASIFEHKPVVEILGIDTVSKNAHGDARSYCKIHVHIAGKNLKVLDVIDWSASGKIVGVEAFLG